MGLKSGAVTDALSGKFDSSRYVFVDVEVGMHDHKIHDIGALRYDEAVYHSASKKELFQFINDVYIMWSQIQYSALLRCKAMIYRLLKQC